MNRYNKETLVKLIVLLVLSLIYIRFIVTGDLLKIMHPRLLPFIKFSIVLMIAISICLLINICKNRTKPVYLSGYKLFLIPLIIILLFNPNSDLISSKTIDSKYSNKETNNIASNDETTLDKNTKVSDISDDITVTDENYLQVLNDIYDNTDAYNNKKITVKGFIYKDESFKANQFVIARYFMSCCASDMQLIGFLCSDNKTYTENSWYEITGTVKKVNDNNSLDSLYIEVESSKSIEVPSNQYIYP